ncbi:DMA1 [Auxenochlorella protothecoides x Auxenochlorella symbiontica]
MVSVAANEPEVLLEALRGYGLRAEVVLTRSADEERLSILHAWQDSMLKTNS